MSKLHDYSCTVAGGVASGKTAVLSRLKKEFAVISADLWVKDIWRKNVYSN